MPQVIKTTFQLRRGLEATWKKNNPILASGEPSFVIDKNYLKIGNGETYWNDLKPIGLGQSEISLLTDDKSIVIVDNQISIKGFEEALPGAQPIKGEDGILAWVVPNTTIEKVEQSLKELEEKVYTKEEIQVLYGEPIKFEIFSKPEEALVNISENEIRVMCPIDTKWQKQNVGNTGNANMYYMGFKAYAPVGAVSFKEGDRGIIIDEKFDFNGDFSGTDEYGRNYSVCWLALASYNEQSNTWTYFGKNSTTKKYIGWDYVVEWYDAEDKLMSTDSIRINLSNEECHNFNKPYFMGAINTNTLVQDKNDVLVLYGGSASNNI